MKKILGLCINLWLLMLTDANPLKLIAGDRSVIKKDGATHTISKYYVVPNDYDPNNVTDTNAVTQKNTLRMHSLYSKSMASESIDEEISENKAKNTVDHQSDEDDADVTVEENNDHVNLKPDLNVEQEEEVTHQPDDSTESMISMSTEKTVDSDDLETKASHSLELEDLERRQIGALDDNHLIKMSDDPDSNQVADSDEPIEFIRSQLPDPYNYIQEDPNSIQNIPDSTDTVENLVDQPLTIKSSSTHDGPWTTEDKTTEYFPWTIPTTPNDGLPWHIEDKTIGYHPYTIKQRFSNKAPWNIKSTVDHSPITTTYQSSDPSVTTNGGNILLNPNPSIKSIVHSVQNGIKKPYHVYTYVISPSESLHKVPNAGNVVKVVSRDSFKNHKTTLYGLPTLHGGNKVVYKNQPPQSHYEPQYSLSKLTNDISRSPSSSQVTHHVPTTYELIHKVNPSTLHPQTLQKNNEPQNLVEHGSEPNYKPSLLLSNIHSSESQPNLGEEKGAHTVPEIDSSPGDLLINISSNPSALLLSLGNTEPVSTASASSSSGDPSNVNIIIDDRHTKPNSEDNGNRIQPSLYPALINKGSAHSSVQTSQYPGAISASAFSSTYTNGLDEPVYGGKVYQQPDAISTASASVHTSQYPGSISASASSSTYTNGLNEPVYGGQVYQRPDAISTASANSKYTIVQNDNDGPTQVYGGDTNNDPGYVDKPVYGGQVYQQPNAISTASANSKYTIVQNNNDAPTQVYGGDTNNDPGYIDEPVYGGQVYQQPDAISTASANSKYTIVQNDNDVPTQVHGGDTNNDPGYIDEPVYGGQVYQQPYAISTASANSKYTIVQNNNDVPTQVYGGDTNNDPGYIEKPVYGGQVYQQPDAISTALANSKYTIVQNDYDVPIQVHAGDTNFDPGYISKATAHSEYTNVPIDYGHDTNIQPGQITEDHQHHVYLNVVDGFDDSSPVNDVQIQKDPGYIPKYSAHSKFTIPVNNNVPTQDYKVAIIHPEYTGEVNHYIKAYPINGGPTQNGDNYLVPKQPYRHIVHVIHQPSVIKTTSGNQNLKLAPTYRLFTLENLQNLENAIIKTIRMHGPGFHNDRALINLKKIIKVILQVAEHLEETSGPNAWYEKIFYNSELKKHPLQYYVYKLIRQRWLHELMLVLYKNNFRINILKNPRIFTFLESWDFPDYVQNFMEAEVLMHILNPQNNNDISNNQNYLQHKVSTHTYHDFLDVPPVDLAKYVTKKVIDSYKKPNEGIVLSIAGVEPEPDANAIINILQNYLHYKNYIKTQENVIIHDNKVDMLKQIILFLTEKGYSPITISDLIQKLYTAIYSTEGKDCNTQHPNFSKNMYDVILPVLRRSAQ